MLIIKDKVIAETHKGVEKMNENSELKKISQLEDEVTRLQQKHVSDIGIQTIELVSDVHACI